MKEKIDLKKTLLSFRSSEAYNRLLFENTPIGLALCRMNGELVDVNEAFAKIIGCSIAETLELTYWDITPKKYEASEAVQLENLKQTRRYGPYEKEYTHKDGHLVPVRLTGQIINLDGEDFIWSSVEDISERVQLEAAKTELILQLMQMQKLEAMGQLVSGIAHDFNNTLGCIMGFGNLAAEQAKNGNYTKIQDYLSKILRSSEHSREMIQNLLTFVRGTDSKKQPLSLKQFINDAKDMLAISIPSHININFNLAEGLPQIKANSGQLKQVVLNLCLNAKDAIGQNEGQISVNVRKESCIDKTCQSCHCKFSGEYVKVEVQDSGDGIDKDQLTRIFDPFFTTKAIGKGTGIGLSISHGITHDHGGHITVSSSPGSGTQISLYIPVLESNPD